MNAFKKQLSVASITPENLLLLKQQSLSKFDSLSLGELFEDPKFDIAKVHTKLAGYTSEELKTLDFENVLEEDYDAEYFERLHTFLVFSTEIYSSNLFDDKSTLLSRETAVKSVLIFVFENSATLPNVVTSCGSGYRPLYEAC